MLEARAVDGPSPTSGPDAVQQAKKMRRAVYQAVRAYRGGRADVNHGGKRLCKPPLLVSSPQGGLSEHTQCQ